MFSSQHSAVGYYYYGLLSARECGATGCLGLRAT
jgi:hypothetical protein